MNMTDMFVEDCTPIFGTYKVPRDNVREAVVNAIKAGYRKIDTAELYRNQVEVGDAINLCICGGYVKREDLFITTKVSHKSLCRNRISESIELSLRELNLKYVDLVLLHYPEQHIENWRRLVEYQSFNSRKVKNIGVSNFSISHLKDILDIKKPFCNQIEINPLYFRKSLIDYCQKNSIIVTAHSLLSKNRIYDNAYVLSRIKDVDCSLVQSIIGWLISNKICPIIRSEDKIHLQDNLDIKNIDKNMFGDSFDDQLISYLKYFNIEDL